MRLGSDKEIKQVTGKGELGILLEKGDLRVNNRLSDEQEFSAGSRLEMRTRAPSWTGSVAFCSFACRKAHIYLKRTEFPAQWLVLIPQD